MSVSPLQVLVVDDSLLYRKVIRDALSQIPGVEVVGVAGDGESAIEKIHRIQPDMVTLDVEMPVLDGLGVLKRLREKHVTSQVVMVSSLTRDGADATMKALRAGAFDFVVKPTGSSPAENQRTLQRELQTRVDMVRAKTQKPMAPRPRVSPSPRRVTLGSQSLEAVGLGISTGGPDALRRVIPQIPGDFPAPILIVQHMPPVFTQSLAKSLDEQSPLRVGEATDGEVVQPGSVWIAPGGKQMKVVRDGGQVRIQITEDPPENSCRPAVDYLFRSLANVYGSRTLGVIMTGMGHDGLSGCKELKQVGATILAQDEASSVVYGMPRAIQESALADEIVSLPDMAERIRSLIARGCFV